MFSESSADQSEMEMRVTEDRAEAFGALGGLGKVDRGKRSGHIGRTM